MKKPWVVSFLITLLLAAAACTHGTEYVTDKDGNYLEQRRHYFILPVNTDGGGLEPVVFDARIPIQVGISPTLNPNDRGTPVILSYPFPQEFHIQISYPVCIEYNPVILPTKTKFWNVDVSSSSTILVDDRNRWFNIEKAGDGEGPNTYKFTTSSGPVGTKPWNGIQPLLAVTNDSSKILLVKFSKVDHAVTATTSTSRVDKLGLRMFPFY